jgi:hypothetical protein
MLYPKGYGSGSYTTCTMLDTKKCIDFEHGDYADPGRMLTCCTNLPKGNVPTEMETLVGLRRKKLMAAIAATALVTAGAINTENANAEPVPGTKYIRMTNDGQGAAVVNMCIDNVTQQSLGHCTGNIIIGTGRWIHFPYNDGDELTFIVRVVAGTDVSTRLDQPTSSYKWCYTIAEPHNTSLRCVTYLQSNIPPPPDTP